MYAFLRRVTTIARLGPIVATIAIVVVVLMTLGLSLTAQRAFHGTDILESFAPWRSVPPDGVEPSNILVGDTVDVVLPAKAVFKDRLYDGDIAMWSGSVLGGRPLAAIPSSGTFSPLNLPYWVFPLWYAPGLVKLLELSIAIGFTALFLRKIGLGRASALVGGLIFAFSGFQVAWNNWPQTHVGALIAALFWAVEFAIRRGRVVASVPIALVVATMWLEGFPSVTGYALLFGGVYGVVRLFSVRKMPRRIIVAASAIGAVVVGTSLAAIQLIPFYFSLQGLDLSGRAQSTAIHLPMRVMATFVVPNAFGSPVDRNYFGPINYIEIQSYIGVVALLLVVTAIAYGRKVVPRSIFWYFVSAISVAMVALFVGGPLLGVLQRSPLFGMNFVGRMRSVLGFLLAVVAAFGFEALVRALPSRSKTTDRVVFGVALVAVGGVIGGALYRSWQMAIANEQTDYLSRLMLVAAVVFVAGIVVIGIAHRQRGVFGTLPVIVLPFLIAFEIVRFATPFWPQVPVEQFYPTTASHKFLSEKIGNDRVAVAGLAMYPSTTALYGLRSVTGHAFHAPAWQDLLEEVDPDVMQASPTFSIFASNTEIAGSPILDRLSARFFVADPRIRIAGVYGEVESDAAVTMNVGFEAVIPLQGPVRGISMRTSEGFDPGEQPDQILLEALDVDGNVVGSGFRRFDAWQPAGLVSVALPESRTAPPVSLRLRYQGDTPIVVQADLEGEPSIGLIFPKDDGLRIAFVGGTVIYERLAAISRVRWAGRAIVIEDPVRRIESLGAGIPRDTVVLSEPGPLGIGAAAELTSVDDDGDTITIQVDAEGAGYVVVADSMQDGWIATVDGAPATVVAADHAVAAVWVPEGIHTIVLSYEPMGWTLGRFVTIASVLVLLVLAAGAATRSRLQKLSTDGRVDER